MTQDEHSSMLAFGLGENQPKIEIARTLLSPLRKGKPVVLIVDDPRLPKRKRIEKPLLFLTPMSVYRGVSRKLMVALEANGCEVLDTRQPIKPMHLYRLGLSLKFCTALAAELNLVFT